LEELDYLTHIIRRALLELGLENEEYIKDEMIPDLFL